MAAVITPRQLAAFASICKCGGGGGGRERSRFIKAAVSTRKSHGSQQRLKDTIDRNANKNQERRGGKNKRSQRGNKMTSTLPTPQLAAFQLNLATRSNQRRSVICYLLVTVIHLGYSKLILQLRIIHHFNSLGYKVRLSNSTDWFYWAGRWFVYNLNHFECFHHFGWFHCHCNGHFPIVPTLAIGPIGSFHL